jgi:hypothetical protein
VFEWSLFGALREKSSHPRAAALGADGLYGGASRFVIVRDGEDREETAVVAAGRDKLQKLASERRELKRSFGS